MKYIVASDYDGTLFQKGVVSEQTVKAIEEFRAAGNLFGVATGRSYTYGFEVFKRENKFPFDFIITNNGAAAYDNDGNTLFSYYVNGSEKWGKSTLAKELTARLFELTSKPCGMAFEKHVLDFHPDYPCGETLDGRLYSPLSELDKVDRFVSANAVCGTDKQAAETVQLLKEEFGAVLNPMQNGVSIDIAPVGIDKSVGIKRLAECYGAELDNIWTAGDNHNDMIMIEKYHGCAMRTGVKELAEAAEYVCDSVADVIGIVLEKANKGDQLCNKTTNA